MAILRKLEWYRAGGEVSDRRWRDGLGILRLGELDLEYLEHTAEVVGLAGLLLRRSATLRNERPFRNT